MSKKLFIWSDVLWDYGPGKAFAMAESKERAIELLRKKFIEDDCDHDEGIAQLKVEQLLSEEPKVFDEEGCDYLRGSS